MIRTYAAILAAGLALAGNAWSQDKQTAQQERMKSCNAQANKKDMKGEERKAFMSDCLSNKPAAAAEPKTQQDKMSACSKQGKGKKGDDYKKFMSDCLSKPAA